jgi:glycosyltransferase involved in cell wall biosynthesis
MSGSSTYILVSPVKDEEKYIERTIHAILKQTVRPHKWIIVDDGSLDRTHAIVEEYARKYDWIMLASVVRDAARQPGSGIIRAFNVGYALVKDMAFDFIVKFDCDIEFPPDYFEQLIARFKQDDKLGIASGIYLEKKGDKWVPVTMPAYHAAGQTKMVRAKCFADIGGFVVSRGWDTVDEIRAQAMGWKTRHFEELFFYSSNQQDAWRDLLLDWRRMFFLLFQVLGSPDPRKAIRCRGNDDALGLLETQSNSKTTVGQRCRGQIIPRDAEPSNYGPALINPRRHDCSANELQGQIERGSRE